MQAHPVPPLISQWHGGMVCPEHGGGRRPNLHAEDKTGPQGLVKDASSNFSAAVSCLNAGCIRPDSDRMLQPDGAAQVSRVFPQGPITNTEASESRRYRD